MLVLASLDIGTAMLLLSGLSFLGLGAKPPTAEWGSMVSTAVQNFDSWWMGVFPGLAILTVVMAFNFLGDALRDALDPRTAGVLGKAETRGDRTKVLDIAGLTVGIGGAEILRGVDLAPRGRSDPGSRGRVGVGQDHDGLAVLGLLPSGSHVTGSITYGDLELVGLPPRRRNALRGTAIAMVFQDPSTSLHPMLSVGAQLTDHLRHHLGLSRSAARDRAVELLDTVRIPDPAGALRRYPHQFSGGQRQRIAIAIALACSPRCSSPTSPPPRSTSPCRPGCCTCCATWRRRWAWPSCW